MNRDTVWQALKKVCNTFGISIRHFRRTNEAAGETGFWSPEGQWHEVDPPSQHSSEVQPGTDIFFSLTTGGWQSRDHARSRISRPHFCDVHVQWD
jgi:hypothetical protein